MISFRMDIELLDKINRLKEPKTDVIHKALELYLHSSENVNTPYKESVNTKRNTTVNTVNHSQKVNQVNPSVQIIENYELLEYLKRDHEWLQDRIKHFENTQDVILAKLDIQPVKDKPSVSWVRM